MMLAVNKHRDLILREFYLDSNDVDVRRNVDGWRNKYKKGDLVIFHKAIGNLKYTYSAVHLPRTREKVLKHHLITLLRGIEIPEGHVIDHVNGDISDDSAVNLRVTTQKFNARNSKMPKNNTSGYTGISYNKNADLWYIRQRFDGIRMYKSAKTLDEAIAIQKQMKQLGYTQGYTERHGK